MKRNLIWALSLGTLLFLAACGGAPAAEPVVETAPEPAVESESDEMMEEMSDDEMMEDMSDDEMMEESHSDEMAEEMSDDEMMEESHSDEMMDEMSDDEMMEEMSDDEMMEEMSDGEMMDDMAEDAMIEAPVWQTLPLTNAETGETFTFADFRGQTVFVEPMATWCSNCTRQLGNVAEAEAQVGDDVVFIILSVETNITNETLAEYNAAFPFIPVVATPELLTALADEFGRTVANPPATPHFIISPDGTWGDLVTGIEPASSLLEQINAARG